MTSDPGGAADACTRWTWACDEGDEGDEGDEDDEDDEEVDMRAEELVRRPVVAVEASATIADVAEVMDRTGVGMVVVVRWGEPVGVVTDRDLVRRALRSRKPYSTHVHEVMSSPVVCIDAGADLRAVFDTFRTHPVRRLVVVQASDGHHPVGVISVDELVAVLTSELADVVRPIRVELAQPFEEEGRAPTW